MIWPVQLSPDEFRSHDEFAVLKQVVKGLIPIIDKIGLNNWHRIRCVCCEYCHLLLLNYAVYIDSFPL